MQNAQRGSPCAGKRLRQQRCAQSLNSQKSTARRNACGSKTEPRPLATYESRSLASSMPTALQTIANQMNDTQRKALIGTPICSLDASLHLNAKIEVLEQGRPLTMSPNVEPQARPMLWRRFQESMGRAGLGGRMPLVSGKSRHCVPQIQEQRCPDLRAPCPQAAGPEDA